MKQRKHKFHCNPPIITVQKLIEKVYDKYMAKIILLTIVWPVKMYTAVWHYLWYYKVWKLLKISWLILLERVKVTSLY